MSVEEEIVQQLGWKRLSGDERDLLKAVLERAARECERYHMHAKTDEPLFCAARIRAMK